MQTKPNKLSKQGQDQTSNLYSKMMLFYRCFGVVRWWIFELEVCVAFLISFEELSYRSEKQTSNLKDLKDVETCIIKNG